MLPNFLIIGAARAGTTLLYRIMKQHPDVFLSEPKELRFFAKEGAPDFRGPGDRGVNNGWVTSWDDYQSYFAAVNGETAIGEASPFYLCSEEAPQRIRNFLPDAKLIIVLRDPVSRAYSSFMYLRRSGREPLTDFSAALEAEDERCKDNWEYLWRYRALGCYSDQVERYFKLFPREQIWIGLYDDLDEDPVGFTRSVFRHIGVDDSFEPKVDARINASGVPRSLFLQRTIDRQNPIRSFARMLVPEKYRKSIRVALTDGNLRRPEAPGAAEQELRAYFRPEVERLEALIERDLSAWKD